MKRKKRAKKSIESIKKRIEEHEIKREMARMENKEELVKYYAGEISNLKDYLRKKEKIESK